MSDEITGVGRSKMKGGGILFYFLIFIYFAILGGLLIHCVAHVLLRGHVARSSNEVTGFCLGCPPEDISVLWGAAVMGRIKYLVKLHNNGREHKLRSRLKIR